MMDFLKFISYSIKSINGDRDSAIAFSEEIFKQQTQKSSNLKGYNLKTARVKQECDHKVMTMGYRKYLFLKIKCKISFMAF